MIAPSHFRHRFQAAPLVFLVWALGVAGCERQASSVRPELLQPHELFRLHCSGCHGEGDGRGHVAGTLPLRPRDLTQPSWQRMVSDDHLTRVIVYGGPAVNLNAAMPAFENKLSDGEVRTLVKYIRSLQARPADIP